MMKNSYLSFSLFVLLILTGFNAKSQNIFDPNDKDSVFNPNVLPPLPPWGIAYKWGHAQRLNWGGTGTTSFKSYYYKGMQFRLKFPKSYVPGVNDGKKYPIFVFLHGAGEGGNAWDNEFQMFHGGQTFRDAVDRGTFDGYLLYYQSSNGYAGPFFDRIANILDTLTKYNKVDLDRVSIDGLSSGGQSCWDFLNAYPKYISAAPIISAARSEYIAVMPNYIQIPIWLFNGGQDSNPDPATATSIVNAFLGDGGNIKQNFYPTLGHNTWDAAWADPGFFPFLNAAHKANPLIYFGKSNFCPGDVVSSKLGISPGFYAYQWMKDGSIISGATSNTYTATQFGTYSVRFMRTSTTPWSDWSHTPAVITFNQATTTPPIQINGLRSDVVPAPDTSTTTQLILPSGYATYKWVRTSDSAVVNTQNIFNAPAGTYVAAVRASIGCSSSYSSPFTVINANGPNPPDPAANLIVNPVSQTSLQLGWSKNPHPSVNETGFEIYRGTTPGGPYKLVAINPRDSLNYLDQGLNSNTSYYYIVRAIDNTAASKITNEGTAKTTVDNVPPTAPSNLATVGSSGTSVSLQWTAASDNVGVAFYDIYVNSVKAYTTAGTNLNFVVNNLTHDQTYNFSVKARDLAGNLSPASNIVTASAVYAGLTYKYYLGTWSALPNFNTLTPFLSGSVNNVNLSLATQPLNFGFLWQGYLNIRTAGTYILETSSDDGSALYLGPNGGNSSPYNPPSAPLINNDGLHGTQSRTASVNLTPGFYPISVVFFQAGGGAAMQLFWSCASAGIARSVIPDSAFNENITLAGGAPAVPTSLTATAQSYKKVNLAWTNNNNNGNNPTGFQIFRSSNKSPFTAIGSTNAGTFAFQDTVVSPATTYSYAIQADDKFGQSGLYPVQGVTYSYYKTATTLSALPNFNTMTAFSTGVVPNFILGMQTQSTNFAVKYDGYISITQQGTYTFSTTSDDGSALYIGGYNPGNIVVNNDGNHGMLTISGNILLTPGLYPITVVYYQGAGGFGLNVNYSGPGITNQVIPMNVLTSSLVSATTPGLPAPPQSATGLQATVLTSSSIGLVWNDLTGDATGFQINRSTGNSSNFHVIANLTNNGGTQFRYTDSALFDNVIYYYSVTAIGPGGPGTPSNVASGTTPLNNPVINPIANFTMHYATNDTVPITVTDKDAVPLTISGSNLPAFAQLVDNGNGSGRLIFRPAVSDVGVYNNIILIATANNGGIGKDTFNLIVNSNYPPVMANIPDANFDEGTKDTVVLTATDQNGTVGLVWSSPNLPAFASIVDNGNGSANLVLKPNFISHGSYNITVTVSDQLGGASTKSFTLTINKKNPNQRFLVNMEYHSPGPSPWNNMTSSKLSNLINTDGQSTNVSVSLSTPGWWQPYNLGAQTGNNSGVYPDAVMLDYYYFGIYGGPDVVYDTITGLKPNASYNFKFFASSTWTGVPDNGTTVYTIGAQSASLYTQNNTLNTANINGAISSPTGTIIVSMSKAAGTPIGLLNAFEFSYIFNDSTAPAKPTNLAATLSPGVGVQLTWNAVAYNALQYYVYRTTDTLTAFTLLNAGANNGTATSYTDSTVAGHTTYYYKLKAVNGYGDLGFTNTVAITTGSKNPTVSSIANVTVKTNATATINFTATDDPGDSVTVTTNAPSFATLNNLGGGNFSIHAAPLGGNAGIYNVSVTATDSYGAVTTSSFQLFVIENNVSSVFVRFGPDTTAVAAPWNNFLGYPFANRTLNNLQRADGTNSGINLLLVDQWSSPPIDYGMSTGDNSGVFPDKVLKYAYYETSTSPRRIQLTGLDQTKMYNIVVLNSVNGGFQASSTFTVSGGQNFDMDASYNTRKTMQFNGLQPDASGSLTITMVKDAASNFGAYLNALVIESYDPAIVPIVSPSKLFVEPLFNSRNSLSLIWADRSNNETGFEVWRSNSASGPFNLVTTLPANTTAYTDQGLTSNTQYFYQIRAVNASVQSDYSGIYSATTPSSIVLEHLTWHYPEALRPWNNTATNPQVGDIYGNLVDDHLTNSGYALTVINDFNGEASFPVHSTNNSYIFPDSVMSSNYWVDHGQIATLKLYGLDQTKKFRIGYEGQTTWQGNMTATLTINGVKKYLNTYLNTKKVVYFDSVTVNGNGEVYLDFSATGTYGFFGSLVIMGYTPNGAGGGGTGGNSVGPTTQLASMAVSQETVDSSNGLMNFRAYPDPFRDGFSISFVNDKGPQKLDIEVYNSSGQMIYAQQGGYSSNGVNTIHINMNQATEPGLYFARIKTNGKISKVFKLIKIR